MTALELLILVSQPFPSPLCPVSGISGCDTRLSRVVIVGCGTLRQGRPREVACLPGSHQRFEVRSEVRVVV